MTETLQKRKLWLVVLWFVLLAILFTWPLVLHMKDEIAGEIGDNVYFIWMIGWVQKALFQQHSNPMNVWFLNYPEGWNLASTEIAPAQLALALPFSLIGGETFGYNMAMLLSFVLSGLLMYGWVQHLTGSAVAGIISGTAYACLPYWQAHFLAGHLNLCGMQWIPLFYWGWFDMLRPNWSRVRKGAAFKAAAGLGLTALCSQYFVYMLLFVTAGMTLLYLLFRGIESLKKAAFWKTMSLFAVLLLPLLLAAELPFVLLENAGGMPDRGWAVASMYSASLTDFLTPATTHFALGAPISQLLSRDLWIESSLYIGIVVLLLFLYGMIRLGEPRWVRFLLISGVLIAVLLAFGTDLHWNEKPVMVNVPEFLQPLVGAETTRVFLPGIVLFKYFPYFNKMRALMRFGLFALVLIAAGAGFGVKKLVEKVSPRQALWVGFLLIGLVILDFKPAAYSRFSQISARPVDEWLAAQPGDGAVMNLPFELNDDQAATYYTLKHEKPFIGGFFNAFPPAQYQQIQELMETFPSNASLEKARELGVTYFLLDRPAIERNWQDRNETIAVDEYYSAVEENGLRLQADFGEIAVYGWDQQ